MEAILDIPDEALGEMRTRSKTAQGIPINAVVSWTPNGVPSVHFISFLEIPAGKVEDDEPKPIGKRRSRSARIKTETDVSAKSRNGPIPESLEEIRKRWPWAGIAAEGIRHDVSHDWVDIQHSIEEGWAEEVAEKERRIFEEYAGGRK